MEYNAEEKNVVIVVVVVVIFYQIPLWLQNYNNLIY